MDERARSTGGRILIEEHQSAWKKICFSAMLFMKSGHVLLSAVTLCDTAVMCVTNILELLDPQLSKEFRKSFFFFNP